MSATEDLIKNIAIPKMVKIRQKFERPRIEDVGREVREKLGRPELMELVKPGMQIAITAGSRGVANIALILREIVKICQDAGAFPFVIPAMGSHGGATAEGQREILNGYGVTEEFLGCPVKCSMEVKQIAALDDGVNPVFIDKYAAEADGIIVVGRVKPHTLFHDRIESGICKMMAIGLGKQKGAEQCHKYGPYKIAENIQRYGYTILEHANILFALGVVENAYEETAIIQSFAKDEIYDKEPLLLEKARNLMPCLMFKENDILIVDEIGKNISGDGMDPNITGRYIMKSLHSTPESLRILVLDIAEESHGNGVGIGYADMTTQRAADKFDRDKTYPNGLTSQILDISGIPPVFRNDKLCIQAALKTIFGIVDTTKARIIRIKNTMRVDEIEISEALLPEAIDNPNIQVLSEPAEFDFDEDGNLF